MSDTERQIDEAIEQAANPLAGEQIEGLVSPDDTARDAEPLPGTETPPAEQPTESWSPPVPERTDEPAPFEEQAQEPSEPQQYDPPTQEQPAVKPEDEEKKDEEGGSDWRTWSGRSVNP
jgi:hypothetical protein